MILLYYRPQENTRNRLEENTRNQKNTHVISLYSIISTTQVMMNARIFAEEKTASYLERIDHKRTHSENVSDFLRDPIVELTRRILLYGEGGELGAGSGSAVGGGRRRTRSGGGRRRRDFFRGHAGNSQDAPSPGPILPSRDERRRFGRSGPRG